MKILLANKFYYRRGGDCIYMLNLEQLLKQHGHEVAIFSMDYPDNLENASPTRPPLSSTSACRATFLAQSSAGARF